MDAPTPDEAREQSAILRAALPSPSGDAELIVLLQIAASLVSSMTCRKIGEDAVGEEVPAGKRPLADKAVIMKAEQLHTAFGTVESATEQYSNGNLQSFTAGPYSESYFGPDAMMKAKRLDPNPMVHEILWALATEECRQGWLYIFDPESNPPPPEAAALAYDYAERPGYGGPANWLNGY